MKKEKCPSIGVIIFLIYSIALILVIPTFVKERILIGSFFIDLLFRAFIVLSLYQSIHFVFYFEQSVTRFYKGVVSFKISDLSKERKNLLVIFCILSGVSAYILLNNLLLFFIPNLGQFSKLFASVYGLCGSLPILFKIVSKDKQCNNRL